MKEGKHSEEGFPKQRPAAGFRQALEVGAWKCCKLVVNVRE